MEMPEVIKLEFQLAEWQPLEPGGRLRLELRNALLHLLPYEGQASQDFLPGIRFADLRLVVRRPGNLSHELVFVMVFFPWLEILFRILQIQEGVKKGVIGDVPNLFLSSAGFHKESGHLATACFNISMTARY